MADCDRSVLVEKEHRLRLSDYIASADNNTFFSANFNAGFFYKLHNARRRTGNKIIIAYHNFAHICGMKRVNVFFGVNCINYVFFINMSGQRQLHQYSVYVFFFVQLFNEL